MIREVTRNALRQHEGIDDETESLDHMQKFEFSFPSGLLLNLNCVPKPVPYLNILKQGDQQASTYCLTEH